MKGAGPGRSPNRPPGGFCGLRPQRRLRRRGLRPASPASFAAPFTGRKPAKLPSATLCKAQKDRPAARCFRHRAPALPGGVRRPLWGRRRRGGLVSAAGLFLGGEGFVQPRHQNAGQYRGDHDLRQHVGAVVPQRIHRGGHAKLIGPQRIPDHPPGKEVAQEA